MLLLILLLGIGLLRILRLNGRLLLRILWLCILLLRVLWLCVLLLRILRLRVGLLRILRLGLLILWLRVGLLRILSRVGIWHLAGDRLRFPASGGDQGGWSEQANQSFDDRDDANNGENYSENCKVGEIVILAREKRCPGYESSNRNEDDARYELGQWPTSAEKRTEEHADDPIQLFCLL